MSAFHSSEFLGGAADAAGDESLIARVLAGEDGVYAALVHRYQERLYRHALGMVLDGDTAADLVQDTFVRAYTSLKRCRDRSKFAPWLFQILRNRCRDHLKERRRRDLPLDDHRNLPDGGQGADADLERWSLRDVLERALAKLPEEQREAFLLKHVQDLTYEEMAEVVDASVSALRMRVMRAREALQSILGKQVDVAAGPM